MPFHLPPPAVARVLAPNTAPVVAAALPTADDLFARMRSKLGARTYPHEISYDVVVEGWDGKAWHPRTYESFAFPGRSEIRARAVSLEERAHPYYPGNDLQQFTHSFGGATSEATDALGPPRLLPTYAFGLIPQPHVRPISATPAAGENLPTIASTVAVARLYDVTLVGAETVNGDLCWHLKLKPRGNPGEYRVRDVWLEQSSDELVRLWTDGNFTSSATGAGIWVVDWTHDPSGAWYIASETSANGVSAADAEYQQMRVRFTDIASDPREFYDTSLNTDTAFLEEP